MKYRNQEIVERGDSGFVATEILASQWWYLAMIAGVIAVIFIANMGKDISQSESNISALKMGIREVYTGASSYADLNNALVISSGIAPKSIIKGNQLKNNWNGDITVGPGSGNTTFTITVTGVPQEAATRLARFQADDWVAVSLNGTALARNAGPGTVTAAAKDDDNIITYESN